MAKVKKPEGFRDGVRKLGPGKFALRVTWHDLAGKRHDTDRVYYCETRPDAIAEHTRLTRELKDTFTGWTVAEALDALLATVRPSTAQSWGSHGRKVKAAFGTRSLGSVQSDELQRFLVALPVSDGVARNVRSMLVRVWERARELGRYNGANPAKATRARHTPKTVQEQLHELENPPRRAMMGDESARLLEALPEDIRPLLTIQLLLGCRFGEASALQWEDINWETGYVRIIRSQWRGIVGPTKSGALRWGALASVGLALLRAHHEHMALEQWPGWETWCFPRPPTRRRSFDLWPATIAIGYVREAQKALGQPLVSRTHAMRHTYITAQSTHAANEAERSLVRGMVGHASATQHAAYIDPRAMPAREIGERVEHLVVGRIVGDGRRKSSFPPEK